MRTLSRMKDVDLTLIFYVNTLLMWRHIHTAAVYSLIPAAYCFKHFTGITTENFTALLKSRFRRHNVNANFLIFKFFNCLVLGATSKCKLFNFLNLSC